MSSQDPDQSPGELHVAATLMCDLIRRPSVTPNDAGCQELLAERLSNAGFSCEWMNSGDVTNLWARVGDAAPLFCFAGHTDVVPAGRLDDWHSDPFEPQRIDDVIYGRGAVDMKGGLAAMVVAAEEFLRVNKQFNGSLAFLITSDEEGAAENGTRKVVEKLAGRGDRINWCVIGEPSSASQPGDVIRIGRRGSLSGRLLIRGIQGHVAYPQHADNPIHRMTNVLSELQAINWDDGDDQFPETSFQIVNVQGGIGAANVIPSEATAEFNLRYSPKWTYRALQESIDSVVRSQASDFELDWQLYGEPFLTPHGDLIDATIEAISETTNNNPALSTGGGTSDGRFIHPAGADVVELGLINATAHKANECTRLDHLELLVAQYRKILDKMLLR